MIGYWCLSCNEQCLDGSVRFAWKGEEIVTVSLFSTHTKKRNQFYVFDFYWQFAELDVLANTTQRKIRNQVWKTLTWFETYILISLLKKTVINYFLWCIEIILLEFFTILLEKAGERVTEDYRVLCEVIFNEVCFYRHTILYLCRNYFLISFFF